MSGAGLAVSLIGEKSLLSTANAGYEGGINMNGGILNVQGCNFHDNDVAISIGRSSAGKVIVNRSKFSNSKSMDVYYSSSSSSPSADFRYNWWGSPAGPSQMCPAGFSCFFDKLDGKIDVSSWLAQEDFRDPVIIIPGILGSFDFFGEKKLDPFLHTYDNLYETFELNGYVPEQKLFTFPYEWRDSNAVNAQKLKIKINEIKQANNWPKVDIVAHSMGGLLAREYIESGYYGNDVDQLITIGTPQKGAPEDYLTWEGGKIASSKFDFLAMFMEDIFRAESLEKGYSNIFDYTRNRPIPSIQELLPVFSYLYDNGNQRIYPNNYPTNSFLETLNNPAGISKLNNVEFDNIVGNLDGSDSTIAKIDVVKNNDDKLWEHGYPEDFDSLIGNHGLKYGDGDGTVPLESASLPSSDEKIEINAKHGDLPTEAAATSFELLRKSSPQNISLSKRIKNLISIFVFSPIDIQVVAPDGKRVGKNFDTGGMLLEIPGAFYTGYNTDSEFLTIPDPKDGEYKILTQGTGEGDYKIEVTKLTEDPDDSQKITQSTATISGATSAGLEEEKTVTVSENDVATEKKDVIPPEITGYVIEKPNENGWYNTDVTVHFDAADNESGIDFVTPDQTLSAEEKNQEINGLAKDKAGNESTFTVSGINIDKAKPEISITSPENGNYYLNDRDLEFKWDAYDSLSGLQTKSAEPGNNLFENFKLDLSLFNLGNHIFRVSARDKAGNENIKEIGFNVITSIDAIKNNTSHYQNLDLIADLKTADFLQVKLKDISHTLDMIAKMGEKNNDNPVENKTNLLSK